MDRIELDEELEAQQEKLLLPLTISPDRFTQKPGRAPKDQVQALADEIYDAFKGYPKPVPYSRIRGIINLKGFIAAERNFRTIQSSIKDPRSSIHNPPALWIHLMNKETVEWQS